jgi:hypothetical protein
MHDISRRRFTTKLRTPTGALLGSTQPPVVTDWEPIFVGLLLFLHRG